MRYSFFSFMSVCDNIMFLKVMSFIKILLDIVFFVVPMGLIVMVSLDFAKNVISGREDDMKKNFNLVIKRLIYAVALFLVPTIVEFAINGLGSFNVEYEDCFNVTKKEISAKIAEQKAKCVGNSWWSDTTYQCIEKEEYNDTAPDTYNTVKRNYSSSATSSNMNSNGGVKNMTYYNQGDYSNVKFCSSGKSLQSSGCGAVSLAMIATSFSSDKYDPKYMAKWLCSNGHGGGALGIDFFTKESMLNHFGLNVETLFKVNSGLFKGNAGKSYDSDKGNKIVTAVKSGKGVILYIPQHYLVVGFNSKCSGDEVYLYDVGKRSNNGCYTIKSLFQHTYNYSNRCAEGGNCGWKAAFAYSKK